MPFDPKFSSELTRIRASIETAIECVDGYYQNEIGHLQGEQLASVPAFEEERDIVKKDLALLLLVLADS